MPTDAELADRYEDRTGIAVETMRFYRALAVSRTATLAEGDRPL